MWKNNWFLKIMMLKSVVKEKLIEQYVRKQTKSASIDQVGKMVRMKCK